MFMKGKEKEAILNSKVCGTNPNLHPWHSMILNEPMAR